jgi:hypothetical protein
MRSIPRVEVDKTISINGQRAEDPPSAKAATSRPLNTLFKVYRTLEKEDEWSKKHGSKSWRRVSRP